MAEPVQKGARLEDVINYKPEEYLSAEEYSLIQNILNGNPKFISILRKVFLPSVGDPAMPIEQLQNDVWLSGRDYASIPDAEIKSIVLARQEAIKFIMNGLVKLKVIASSPAITPEELARKKGQDSTK